MGRELGRRAWLGGAIRSTGDRSRGSRSGLFSLSSCIVFLAVSAREVHSISIALLSVASRGLTKINNLGRLRRGLWENVNHILLAFSSTNFLNLEVAASRRIALFRFTLALHGFNFDFFRSSSRLLGLTGFNFDIILRNSFRRSLWKSGHFDGTRLHSLFRPFGEGSLCNSGHFDITRL